MSKQTIISKRTIIPSLTGLAGLTVGLILGMGVQNCNSLSFNKNQPFLIESVVNRNHLRNNTTNASNASSLVQLAECNSELELYQTALAQCSGSLSSCQQQLSLSQPLSQLSSQLPKIVYRTKKCPVQDYSCPACPEPITCPEPKCPYMRKK